MDTTVLEHIDKIIEASDIPKTTLSLILGKDIEDGRSPGIFTSNDLIKIKSYINKVLILPYQKESVIQFLGYDNIHIPQLLPENILELFLKMRNHAFEWNKIEYAIKQQAIDLEIIGREITSTGEQLLLFINEMPLLTKISTKISDISAKELKNIKYTHQDKEVTEQLISILESMRDDINIEHEKTVIVKNRVYDFRVYITGGENSQGVLCQSLYHDIINKKNIINEYLNNSDSSLIEERMILEEDIVYLNAEYQHFVKLAFTGLAFGIIGVIITGGIFGAKAEEVRKKKNEIINKLKIIDSNISSYSELASQLQSLYFYLEEIAQYIEDANIALEHLEYMWQATLTEINASISNLKKIDNAMELIRFSIYLEKIISPWYMVIGYSKEMILIFDKALSEFYSTNQQKELL